MARRDTGFNYGTQMGLAVADGQIFPIWAGNFYGPNVSNSPPSQGNPVFNNVNAFNDSFFDMGTGTVKAFPLNIWYQPMVIAAGPRIIASTMGPVEASTLTGTSADTSTTKFIPPFNSPGRHTHRVRDSDVGRSQPECQQPRDHCQLADLSHGR